MDKTFDRAFAEVFELEGGFSNDRDDPGGMTKYGIAQRWNPNVDVKNLTPEKAKAIYYNEWWIKFRYNQLKDPNLAIKVFATAINVGPDDAHRFLQQAARVITGESIVVDGILGSKTVSTANRIFANGEGEQLYIGFCHYQAHFYEQSKEHSKYLRGKLRRAFR